MAKLDLVQNKVTMTGAEGTYILLRRFSDPTGNGQPGNLAQLPAEEE